MRKYIHTFRNHQLNEDGFGLYSSDKQPQNNTGKGALLSATVKKSEDIRKEILSNPKFENLYNLIGLSDKKFDVISVDSSIPGKIRSLDLYNEILPKFPGHKDSFKIDNLGYRFIMSFEGYEPVPYPDGAGRYSVGFGTLSTSRAVINPEIAINDMMTYCNKNVEPQLNEWIHKHNLIFDQNMFNAVASFIYNLGTGRLKSLYEGTSEPKGPRNELTIPLGMQLYGKSGGIKNRRRMEGMLYSGLITNDTTFNQLSAKNDYQRVLAKYIKHGNVLYDLKSIGDGSSTPTIASNASVSDRYTVLQGRRSNIT